VDELIIRIKIPAVERSDQLHSELENIGHRIADALGRRDELPTVVADRNGVERVSLTWKWSDMLGEFNSIEGLQKLLRLRIEQTQITRLDLDQLSGLPSGYCSKLFSEVPIKKLGRLSLPCILAALNVKLIAVVDESAAAQQRITVTPRNQSHVRVQAVHSIIFTRRRLQQMGKRGGAKSRFYMSRRQASALGKRAARARWQKASA
jgi:hypothetical protein